MNDAIWYLLKVATNHYIDVQWSGVLSKYTPPACRYDTRIVCMNMKWHRQNEIAFQLAHELSHIINGDPGDACFYNASFTGKSSIEYKANLGAVKILIPYYCDNRERENVNAYEFETLFNVPSYLNDVVIKELKRYY